MATRLQIIDAADDTSFQPLAKRINDGTDVQFWLRSKAYSDIMAFLLQLNLAMFPTRSNPSAERAPPTEYPPIIVDLMDLIRNFDAVIDEIPLDPGPRRFGNISFRKWHEAVQTKLPEFASSIYAPIVSKYPNAAPATEELSTYLLSSFGSAQRLDYGTGHELSFLAFLAGLWKLGAFSGLENTEIERSLVLVVMDPYLRLIRRLIKVYNLEPAGSHGVWGLDDNSFLPYVFGSAQLSASLSASGNVPTEGSSPDAPKTGDIVNRKVVDEWREKNLYFGAIGFIYDIKTGPFWEHSRVLYDVSGVPAGWAKINKGMLKMYHAEVLSKFPVVQHFHFGGLFKWESDTNLPNAEATIHTANQPRSNDPTQGAGTKAPWAKNTPSPATSTSRIPPSTSQRHVPG